MSSLLFFGLVLYGACYYISLQVHPFTKCKSCTGTGRHRGVLFDHASRACGSCGGTSRVTRLGVRLFMNEESMKYRK